VGMDWRSAHSSGTPSGGDCRIFLLATRQNSYSRLRKSVNAYCQIEHVESDSDVGIPCSNRAVAECADCGAAICADCRTWCGGQSFCEVCGDYQYAFMCQKARPVRTSAVSNCFWVAGQGWLASAPRSFNPFDSVPMGTFCIKLLTLI